MTSSSVDLLELRGFRIGRTGHAGQLLVHAEVVLEGDGGQRLVLALDLDAFFGFDGLVQSVRPAPARHQAAGELVDDDDFVVFHHVVFVALEEHVGLESLLHMVVDLHVGGLVKIAHAEQPLDLERSFFGERHAAMPFVHGVIAGGPLLARLLALDHLAADQAGNQAVDLVVLVGGFFAGAGNNQRRPRFVDQDRVHFVDDGVVEHLELGALAVDGGHSNGFDGPLDALGDPELHVVAEVVEPELVVGAVGDVGGVAGPALAVVQIVHDHADAQSPGPCRSGPSTPSRAWPGSR